jgi:hypothetical protein
MVVSASPGVPLLLTELLELVAFYGVVVALPVKGTEWAIILVCPVAVLVAVLMLRFCREDGRFLTFVVLGLGPGHKSGGSGILDADEQTSLLGLGEPIGDLEQLDRGVEVILVDGELLLHSHIGDASGEGPNDLLVGNLGNLAANLAETLDVLAEGIFTALRSLLEAGLSYVATKFTVNWLHRSVYEEIDATGRFISHARAISLRAMGNQFAMTQ